MIDSLTPKDARIVVPGGAGLVGQNLVTRLLALGYTNLVVLDKHQHNLGVLKKLHPQLEAHEVDLAVAGDWARHFAGAHAVVMLQAQIGARDPALFVANNVRSTQFVLEQIDAHQVPYVVHISSSVVNSAADDDYTRTKREQEEMVLAHGVRCAVLRPTLMFGWFDRKHLGWLAQFMRRVPVFPIPGRGRIPRQPLYVGDFCAVIQHCLVHQETGVFDISGVEYIDYVDMIRTIRDTIKARTMIVPIPFRVFDALLKSWAVFDSNPPFTSAQLHALMASDRFEITDWPERFAVDVTPFGQAVSETFHHPVYSDIELRF